MSVEMIFGSAVLSASVPTSDPAGSAFRAAAGSSRSGTAPPGFPYPPGALPAAAR